ncbi:hypothetical protein [Paraburkholderia graminis]|nr:hypothetical protein [Paraburkholderia graminis]
MSATQVGKGGVQFPQAARNLNRAARDSGASGKQLRQGAALVPQAA